MAGLFSKPKMPPPPKPVRMPTPLDQEAQAAGERRRNEALNSRGRASTDLTGDGTSLGN